MKKSKFLALTLVAVIMLMGAGYAWWNDTLYVDSTVNTGFLDVDFVKVEKAKLLGFEVSDPNLVDVTYEIAQDGDFSYGDNEEFDINNPLANRDKVLFTINNFYPGAEVSRVVTVKNTGSVPARIDINKLIPVKHDVPKTTGIGLTDTEEEIEIVVEPVDDNQKGIAEAKTATIYYPLGVNKEMSFRVNFKFKSNSGNETEHKTYEYLMELPFEQGDGIL